MAEWYTCFDGCECSDCRQRRCDYMDMQIILNHLDYHQEAEPTDRLERIMDNLGYSKNLQSSIKKSYRR